MMGPTSGVFALRLAMVVVSLVSARARIPLRQADRQPYRRVPIGVTVDGRTAIASVSDEFLCATLDWWPATKCNYGSCPWFSSSILNLDLDNPSLEEVVTALAPLKLRLGGTLQDHVVYDVGNPVQPCLPFSERFEIHSSALFHFNPGCLSMERWDSLNQFFKKTRVSAVFGLNALYGRGGEHSGLWDSSNAEDFIRYTHDQGYPVTAWELGNELLGTSISIEDYVQCLMRLRTIINDVYPNATERPLVIAPDAFYNIGSRQYQDLLAGTGRGVIDVLTRHFYNLGSGNTSTEELVHRIRTIQYTGKFEEINYAGLQDMLRKYPLVKAWVGESGGAFNSGHKNVTDTFIMAFWYLDQLGLASKYDNQAFCRQSLIGGYYGLLDAVSFIPNPDFYGALLWQRLMGNKVFSAYVSGSTDVRAYAHCQKMDTKGGVTILLLNYNNVTSYDVDLELLSISTFSKVSYIEGKFKQLLKFLFGQKVIQGPGNIQRQEYILSPARNDFLSKEVLLNKRPLRLTSSGKLPILEAQNVDKFAPITLDPLNYAFFVLSDASFAACSHS